MRGKENRIYKIAAGPVRGDAVKRPASAARDAGRGDGGRRSDAHLRRETWGTGFLRCEMSGFGQRASFSDSVVTCAG
jgi:hypothetical protein